MAEPKDPNAVVLRKEIVVEYTDGEYDTAYKIARQQALNAHVSFRLLFEDQASLEIQKWIAYGSGIISFLTFVIILWKIK